ncbi:OmpA family protein [Parasalinivibrio latis]|uniref:OmpA family protein n=1 Tax=Parasalinivibrio latis TaxID=2952610 RepID=UPI0030E424D8
MLMLNGCTMWPKKGQGGMAEHYPADAVPVMPDQPLGPEHGLRFEWELSSRHLDVLVLEGAKLCFPATVVQARKNQNRIARELHSGLNFDAANDLIVQRNLLSRLERQLDYVKSRNACIVNLPSDSHNPGELAAKLFQLLNSDNQFAFNSPEINPKYMGHLAEAAHLLRELPGYALHITGHADAIGGEKHNKNLALKRAEQVKRYLLIFGLENARITLASVGSEDPLFEGNQPEVRLTNRRVSVELVETSLTPMGSNTPAEGGH